ncbi:hypothetical protein M0R45_007189 [Rubus argutus]|uniref:Uncharacterized protein n=1 Tax=Rubus argutus TaxID=59490 RepID=A0AAW1YUA0_RUBAR
MGSPQAVTRSTQMPKHAEMARAAFHDRVDDVSTGISTARAFGRRRNPRPILKLGYSRFGIAVTKGILVSFFSSAY